MNRLFYIVLCGLVPIALHSQGGGSTTTRLGTWLPYQAIPSLTLYSSSSHSAFGFEWETTPLLYSFGINHQVSPWYAFIVEPTARFSGSIEFTVAGQIYTSKPHTSHFGSTFQVMGYVPIFERGEHLTLNLGAGTFRTNGLNLFYTAAGVSGVFGMLHLNVKHAANPVTWIGSLEMRIF